MSNFSLQTTIENLPADVQFEVIRDLLEVAVSEYIQHYTATQWAHIITAAVELACTDHREDPGKYAACIDYLTRALAGDYKTPARAFGPVDDPVIPEIKTELSETDEWVERQLVSTARTVRSEWIEGGLKFEDYFYLMRARRPR